MPAGKIPVLSFSHLHSAESRVILPQRRNGGWLPVQFVIEPENVTRTVYNCLRDNESIFRTLKTDLDLRPVFHKTDDACMAHLHPGLMACRVVSTVLHQLKAAGINSRWTETVRVMNTQI
jgi:hypothetical protein